MGGEKEIMSRLLSFRHGALLLLLLGIVLVGAFDVTRATEQIAAIVGKIKFLPFRFSSCSSDAYSLSERRVASRRIKRLIYRWSHSLTHSVSQSVSLFVCLSVERRFFASFANALKIMSEPLSACVSFQLQVGIP